MMPSNPRPREVRASNPTLGSGPGVSSFLGSLKTWRKLYCCLAYISIVVYDQRRNETTGEDDYVGAGTFLDTDVVATTATKV